MICPPNQSCLQDLDPVWNWLIPGGVTKIDICLNPLRLVCLRSNVSCLWHENRPMGTDKCHVNQVAHPCGVFSDLSVLVVSIKSKKDLSPIEAGWNTPQTCPVVCRHGSVCALSQSTVWTETEVYVEPRQREFKHWLLCSRRSVFGLSGQGPVSVCLGGWSVCGLSVCGCLDSKPSGWFDRLSDITNNEQTNCQNKLTIHTSNRLICKHTNQPSVCLALNPTTDQMSMSSVCLLTVWSDLIWSDLSDLIWSDLIWSDLIWSVWSDLIWSDLIWSDLIWSDLIWSDLIWSDRSDLIWSDLIWSDLIWSDLIWSDLIWSDLIWSDLIWSDLIWSDLIWSDLIWSDLIWSDLIWSDLIWIWSDLIWSDLIWSDLIWSDLIWSDLIWSDLIWSDLIWSDLIWSDLIWSDLIWSDLIWSDLIWSDLIWSDSRADLMRISSDTIWSDPIDWSDRLIRPTFYPVRPTDQPAIYSFYDQTIARFSGYKGLRRCVSTFMYIPAA